LVQKYIKEAKVGMSKDKLMEKDYEEILNKAFLECDN